MREGYRTYRTKRPTKGFAFGMCDLIREVWGSYLKDHAAVKRRMVEWMGGSCESCGYDRCLAALDFHHRNPEDKKFNLATAPRRKWEEVIKELTKCVLLCSNCHREYHAGALVLPKDSEELGFGFR